MLRQIKIQRKFGDKSPNRYLRMEFTDVDGTAYIMSRQTKEIVKKSDMLPGDEPELAKISAINPDYIIKYDDESDLEINTKNKRKAMLLRRHPCVMVVSSYGPTGEPIYDSDSNPNLRTHQFDYIDETACHIQNVAVFKKYLRNMNVVNQMSQSERADVIYHFGRNPAGMKNSDMLMFLADPTEGLVVRRDRYDSVPSKGGERIRTYMDYFFEVYDDKSQYVYLETLVKKALLITSSGKPIITRRKDGSYWINEADMIGMTLSDVINKLTNDSRVLEYVRREVQKGDSLAEDDIPELLKAKGFRAAGGEAVEIPGKELIKESDFRERESLFEFLHNDCKMIDVRVDDPIDELRAKRDDAKAFFHKVKIKGFSKLFEANLSWTYGDMQREYDAGMEVSHGAKRKAYLAKRLAETSGVGGIVKKQAEPA